jgi:hypothetical protein
MIMIFPDEEGRILAWHFLPEDCKLRHGDGRRVCKGETYSVDGNLILCKNAMHASQLASDALHYAPGPMLARVELIGEKKIDEKYPDKIGARSRKELSKRVNVYKELTEFTSWCLERAMLHIGKENDSVTAKTETDIVELKTVFDDIRICERDALKVSKKYDLSNCTNRYDSLDLISCAYTASDLTLYLVAKMCQLNGPSPEYDLLFEELVAVDKKLTELFNKAIEERG